MSEVRIEKVTKVENTLNKYDLVFSSNVEVTQGDLLVQNDISLTVLKVNGKVIHVRSISEPKVGVYSRSTTVYPVQLGSLENVRINKNDVVGIFHPSKIYLTPKSFAGMQLCHVTQESPTHLGAYPVRQTSLFQIKSGSLRGTSVSLQIEIPKDKSINEEMGGFFYIYGVVNRKVHVYERQEVRVPLSVGYFVDKDRYQKLDEAQAGFEFNLGKEMEVVLDENIEFERVGEEGVIEVVEKPQPEQKPEVKQAETQDLPSMFMEVGMFICELQKGNTVSGTLVLSENIPLKGGHDFLKYNDETEGEILLQIISSAAVTKKTKRMARDTAKILEKTLKFSVILKKGSSIKLGTYTYIRGIAQNFEIVPEHVAMIPDELSKRVFALKKAPVLDLRKKHVGYEKPWLYKEAHAYRMTMTVQGSFEPPVIKPSELIGEIAPPKHPLMVKSKVFFTISDTPKSYYTELGYDIEEANLIGMKEIREMKKEGIIYDVDALRRMRKKKLPYTSTLKQQNFKSAEELAEELSRAFIQSHSEYIRSGKIKKRLEEKLSNNLVLLYAAGKIAAKTGKAYKERFNNVKSLLDIVTEHPFWSKIESVCNSMTLDAAYQRVYSLPEVKIIPNDQTGDNNFMILLALENALFEKKVVWYEGNVRRSGKVLSKSGITITAKDDATGEQRTLFPSASVKTDLYYPFVGEKAIVDNKVGTCIGVAHNYAVIKLEKGPVKAYPLDYDIEWGSVEVKNKVVSLPAIQKILSLHFSDVLKSSYGMVDSETVNNKDIQTLIAELPSLAQRITPKAIKADLENYIPTVESLPPSFKNAVKRKSVEELKRIAEKEMNSFPENTKLILETLASNNSITLEPLTFENYRRVMADLKVSLALKLMEQAGIKVTKKIVKVETEKGPVKRNEYIVGSKKYLIFNDLIEHHGTSKIKNTLKEMDDSMKTICSRISFNSKVYESIIQRASRTLKKEVITFIRNKNYSFESVINNKDVPEHIDIEGIKSILTRMIKVQAKTILQKVKDAIDVWSHVENISGDELLERAKNAIIFVSDIFARRELYFKSKLQSGEYDIENLPYFTEAHYLPEFYVQNMNNNKALKVFNELLVDVGEYCTEKIMNRSSTNVYRMVPTRVFDKGLELSRRLESYANEWFKSVEMQCFDTNSTFNEDHPRNIVLCGTDKGIVCYSIPDLIRSIYGDQKDPNNPSRKLSGDFVKRMKARYPKELLEKYPPIPSDIVLVKEKDKISRQTLGNVVKAIHLPGKDMEPVVRDIRRGIDDELLEKLQKKYPKELLSQYPTSKVTKEGEFEVIERCLGENEPSYVIKGIQLIDSARENLMTKQLRLPTSKGYRVINVGPNPNADIILCLTDKDTNITLLSIDSQNIKQIFYLGTKYASFVQMRDDIQRRMSFAFTDNRYHLIKQKPSESTYIEVVKQVLRCVERTLVIDKVPEDKEDKIFEPRFLNLDIGSGPAEPEEEPEQEPEEESAEERKRRKLKQKRKLEIPIESSESSESSSEDLE